MEIFLDVFKWSIIAGAAVLLLTLLKPVLSKRYSARWRYWVWLALAILSLPVRWEMSEPLRTPVEIQVPDVEIRIPGSSISTVPESDGPSVQLDGTGKTWRVQDHLPYIWLVGISLFALYHLSGNLFFRHKVRRWRHAPGEETAKFYGAVCQDMGVKNAPPLWVSGGVGSPVLLGIFRPCLILPGEEWGEQQLSFIFRHELTHYRRHDLWYKLVLLAANAVHWFNPLMYLMVREAGADMELTCDAAVVAGADTGTRRAYSETLLAAVHRERGSAFSTHFYGGKKAMKERFRNILGKQGQKWGVLLLLLTLLATLTAAAAVRFQQAEDSLDAEERDEISAYIDGKIAELAERGYVVSDERSKFTLEGEYSGDLWPDEIQVWHLDYALKLENPESYAPAGSESVDGGGWLSGIEGQGDPYFIFSVDHEQKTNELLEIAYANARLGYSWEEYVCCHTILGMDPVRWPEISPEFLAAQRDGHQAGMADWEDAALTYLTVIMELEPPENGLSVLREFSREDGESRLIAAQYGEQKVYVLLVKNVYPEEAFSFWQVAGLCWQKRP